MDALKVSRACTMYLILALCLTEFVFSGVRKIPVDAVGRKNSTGQGAEKNDVRQTLQEQNEFDETFIESYCGH